MLTPDEGHLDRRIAQEAGTLALRGWQVDIHPAVDPGLIYEGDVPPGVRLLANPGLPIRAPNPGRRLLRQFKGAVARLAPAAGRLIETVQYRTRDIAAEIVDANLRVLLGLGPYDLVFAHDVPVMPLAARLKAAWGSPLVSDLHEVFPEQDAHFTSRAARAYWRGLEAAGLAASDGILCVNAAVADYVRETHAPAAPIVAVQNSVPYVEPSIKGPDLRSYYPIPDGLRILVFVGSLRPHMNLEVMIEGFAAADLDGWVLAILGEGPLQPTLRDMVGRLGLERRVFLGRRVPQGDLVHVAASADIALLPYRAYGFNYLISTPNKLYEYMQARLPIATSRLPMIERIVGVHGNGGFLDFSTASRLAPDLRAFIVDVAPGITPATLEAAAREFSWENDERAFMELVDLAMATRSTSPAVARPGV
jgi:glycosyltransferase involved in cell wall biosynthesis